MLDPWIIEEILRREEEQRRDERPMLEMPMPLPEEPDAEDQSVREEDDSERGVAIVDFRV